MNSLALRYRPRNFDDLVGQQAVHVFLRQMVYKDAVDSALLFSGDRGCGKTSALRILAAALNCEVRPGPCGHCPSCTAIYTGASYDLIELDAASNGLVDDIRALRNRLAYTAHGNYRVVGLDEAHAVSQAGFNALLKMLEEPPPRTIFVLLTTEPGRIPGTVASRCMPFEFRRLGIADIVWRLDHICTAEGIDVEPGLLHHIAERADGGMRDAVMLLDQITRVGVTTIEQYTELTGETDFAPRLLAALLAGDHASAFGIVDTQMTRTGDPKAIATDLITCLRDLLVLHSGGQITKTGPAHAARKTLAEATTPAVVVAACQILWDLKVKVRAADDQRASLDLATVMLAQTLGPATPAAPAAPAKLTLAEMAALK